MSKKEIIERVDLFAQERGLRRDKEYSWLWKGPTFIYNGTDNPHDGLTIGDVKHIEELGAVFGEKPIRVFLERG